MMLTLWRCQRPSLYGRPAGVEPAFCRFWRLAGSSLGKRKPPRGFPLGRLPASASWRLHGNHSAGQGSLKLRDWIHVPGSFWQLQCRHTSMVSRLPAQGNCIYRRVVDPGSGRHRDAAARTPAPGRPPGVAARPPGAAAHRPPPGAATRRPAPAKVVDAAACTLECARCRNHTMPPGPAPRRTCRRAPGPSAVTGHCLEKTKRFNTPPAPVFPELCQVTCGWFVHKPVDNQCDVRITNRVLWATCGQRKNPKMNYRWLLRDAPCGR
jgi:hypothetical protein